MSISATMKARKKTLGRLAVESESATTLEVDASISGEVEFKILLKNFHAVGQGFDAIETRSVTNAGGRRNRYGSLPGHLYSRLDDVFFPVSPARRDVSRKRKIRQR